MESLIGYGSDDDYDEHSHGKKQSTSQADANYEEVQMDLSEDSNDSPKYDNRRQSKDYHSKYRDELTKEKEYKEKDKYKKHYEDKYDHSRSSPKSQDSRYKDKSRDRRKDREDRRSRDREDRRSKDREDRRSKDREDRRSKDREDRRDRDDRHSFDDDRDYKKDRNRDEKARYRDDRGRDNRRGKDDQDRYSHRGSSRERERHRSRSPKRSKRSGSRERTRGGYSKRHDRCGNKMDRLEKLGIELNSGSDLAGTSTETNNDKGQERNRFFMAGITGRFTEQIQRRKLLWQKKEAAPVTEVAIPSQTQKVWQNTTFAQDTDGKVANKFKRLMGMKGLNQSATPKPANDNLRKQEEMFTSMEAQYEVARTATHTMRGVGLGFGAFQR